MPGNQKRPLNWIPTASGAIARAAYNLASLEHLPVEALLEQAGLTLQQANDQNARISVRSQIKFLNLVAQELNDEFLGVRLATQIDLREAGLLYYVMASSDVLGDALRSAARYSGLHNEGVHIVYREAKDASISFEYFGVPRHGDRHQIEFFVTILLRLCRELTELDLAPCRIRLTHHRAKIPLEIRKIFGTDVRYDCRVDEVSYARPAALAPVTRADPYLNTHLMKYYEEALASRPRRSTNWRLKVENALVRHLPRGRPAIQHVSEQLATSPRTLARRLASEGTHFAEVLDKLRCDLAKRYLRERDLPISEVAWLLGYQEPSALNHAFKRWTDLTPKQARIMSNPL